MSSAPAPNSILPRLTTGRDAADKKPTGLGQNKTVLPPRRAPNIVAACLACRKRRNKCSGTRPKCAACIQRSTECEYTTDLQETHVQALKRKYNALINEDTNQPSSLQTLLDATRTLPKHHAEEVFGAIRRGENVTSLIALTQSEPSSRTQSMEPCDYKEFYHLIRSRSAEDAANMLRLVRSGYNVLDLLQRARDGDLLLQLAVRPESRYRYEFPYDNRWPVYLNDPSNPYLKTRLHESVGIPGVVAAQQDPCNMFNVPYHGATLVEPVLAASKIGQWTTIISNETLLIELLERYILHCHPFFTFLHKDLFLRDLRAGRQQFCSALLVNAIMTSATHYHPSIGARNQPWESQSLAYRFFAETKRLWELEIGQISLTTLQATLIMNTVYNLDGLDQVGQIYMDQAVEMAHRLKIFSPNAGSDCPEMSEACRITAWGLFCWQSMIRCHYQQSPVVKTPMCTLANPVKSPSSYGEIHVTYPQSGAVYPLGFPSAFFHLTKFRVVMNDLGQELFGVTEGGDVKKKLSFPQAIKYYGRFSQWFEQLPADMKPANIVFPLHLQLHAHLQYVFILLLESFVPTHGDATVMTGPNGVRVSVTDAVYGARNRLETILRLYYLRHSYSTYSPKITTLLSALGFAFTGDNIRKDDRVPNDTREARASLVLVTLGLEAQGRAAHIPYVIFRLFYSQLPNDAQYIADKYLNPNNAERDSSIMQNCIRSAYPVKLLGIDDESCEENRLSTVIENLARENEGNDPGSEPQKGSSGGEAGGGGAGGSDKDTKA